MYNYAPMRVLMLCLNLRPYILSLYDERFKPCILRYLYAYSKYFIAKLRI